MKRVPTTTLLAVLLFAGGAPGRPQAGGQNVQSPPPPARVGVPPGQVSDALGRFEDGRYINDFFGVSFTVPQGWAVQDLPARQILLEMAKDVIEEGASAKKKRDFETSMNRAGMLFSVSKYPLSAPPPGPNAHFVSMVERLPKGVALTGDGYLAAVFRLAPGTGVKPELVGPARTVEVGGVSFTAADVRITMGAAVIQEKYYVTIRKGYAFMFTYAYLDDADLKTFDEILKSMKFK